jgi:hypothetical protein
VATRLRKDEIERAIVAFRRTGIVSLPTKRALRKKGVKDLEGGLSLNLPIEHCSNRETKDFIVREARRVAPEVSTSAKSSRRSSGGPWASTS